MIDGMPPTMDDDDQVGYLHEILHVNYGFCFLLAEDEDEEEREEYRHSICVRAISQ